MRQHPLPKKKGVALITTVAVLMVLSVMGISFVRITVLEQKSSVNYTDAVSGRWLAMSGIDNAIVQLKLYFQEGNNSLFLNKSSIEADWCYSTPDNDVSPTPVNNPALIAEDDVGAGDPITQIFDGASDHPSFLRIVTVGGTTRRVTGSLSQKPDHVYTTKIFDTASQINLNCQIEAATPTDPDNSHPTSAAAATNPTLPESGIARVLNNLSHAIALRANYTPSDTDAATYGPLHKLGDEIMAKRKTMGGFRSKIDILGTYYRVETDSTVDITQDDLQDVWDYITVHPTAEAMNGQGLYRNIRPTTGAENFTEEYRSPVNINSASWPVLVALLCDIGGTVEGSSIDITENEAKVLSNKICLRRKGARFTGWDDFYTFLDDQKQDQGAWDSNLAAGTYTQVANADKKIALIKANCDPNVTLRKHNPDANLYQTANKTDLTVNRYSMEFCFLPSGYFEITSLGQVLDATGVPQVGIQFYSVTKIFDVLRHTNQQDFEGAAYERYNVANAWEFRDDRIPQNTGTLGLHGFSGPHNMQLSVDNKVFNLNSPAEVNFSAGYTTFNKANWTTIANPTLGHVQPTGYNLRLENGSGMDSSGNVCFAANFNGTLTADVGPSGRDPVATGNDKTASDLLHDGVVFRGGETKTLVYYTRGASDSAGTQGNFPAMTPAASNQGAITFWLKVNKNWYGANWHTIFFSNTRVLGYCGTCEGGIQREIQVRVSGPATDRKTTWTTDTTINASKPLLRSLEIQVRYRFYNYYNGVPTHPDNESPYGTSSYMDKGVRYVLLPNGQVASGNSDHKRGIHAQEWYHVAVLWKTGTVMENFGDPVKSVPIIVSGNFYNDSDQIVHSGSVIDTPHWEHLMKDVAYDTTGTVQKTPELELKYSTSLADSCFDALDSSKRSNDWMYIGYVPGRPTASNATFTIDDVRIIKAFPSTNYLPSRYLKPSSGYVYGTFYGEFTPATTGTVYLQAPFITIRQQNNNAYAALGGAGSENAYDANGDGVMQADEYKDVWIDMTGDNNVPMDPHTGSVHPHEGGGAVPRKWTPADWADAIARNWTISLNISLCDDGNDMDVYVTITPVTDETYDSDCRYTKNHYNAPLSAYEAFQGNMIYSGTLSGGLDTWITTYTTSTGGGGGSSQDKVATSTIAVTGTPNYEYRVNFTINNNTKPIYETAVLEDVTQVHMPNGNRIEYLEYYDLVFLQL